MNLPFGTHVLLKSTGKQPRCLFVQVTGISTNMGYRTQRLPTHERTSSDGPVSVCISGYSTFMPGSRCSKRGTQSIRPGVSVSEDYSGGMTDGQWAQNYRPVQMKVLPPPGQSRGVLLN